MLRILGLLPIDIDLVIHYAQRIARHTDTAFHIVLALIHRSVNHLAKGSLVEQHTLTTILVDQGVIVRILHPLRDGIAGREVEHDNIVSLHLS